MVEYLISPAVERGVSGRAKARHKAQPVIQASAAPLAPGAQPIDFDHLARMTLGERDLERDVLQLFDLQAATLLTHMTQGPPQAVAVLAHTLNGSARGIGAWKVSQAAEALERAATGPELVSADDAIGRLSAAVAEAHEAIVELLHVP